MKTFTIEKDWVTAAGLRAVVLMGDMGHRCGYVGVDNDHPLFAIDYRETHPSLTLDTKRSTEKMSPLAVLCAAGKDASELNTPELVFEVHGCITYSGAGGGKYPVESNLWWYGYDCAHAGDLPEPDSQMGRVYAEMGFAERDGVVRTLDFCIAECEALAKQLAEVKP